MFKGFQDKSRQFNGFPNLNFQTNNEAYGFSGCTFWLDAAYGLNTQTDLAAVSSWQSRIGQITFTQATAGNQPRFIISNAAYNNLPTVEGTTNARFMSSNNSISNFNTIVFIANYNTLNSANVIAGLSINTNYGLGGTLTSPTINGAYVRFSISTAYSGTTENTSSKIVIITNTGIWVNGINEFSGNIILSSFNFLMGVNNTAYSLIGSIAEIICYGSNLENNITQLSNRINSKYAIY